MPGEICGFRADRRKLAGTGFWEIPPEKSTCTKPLRGRNQQPFFFVRTIAKQLTRQEHHCVMPRFGQPAT